MKKITSTKNTQQLIPGTFSKCYYCDVDNKYCRKYDIVKNGFGNGISDYTWENYCLVDGGCDR